MDAAAAEADDAAEERPAAAGAAAASYYGADGGEWRVGDGSRGLERAGVRWSWKQDGWERMVAAERRAWRD